MSDRSTEHFQHPLVGARAWWDKPLPLDGAPEDVLAEQLALCHRAARLAMSFFFDENTTFKQGFDAANIATRLMNTSMKLAAALKSPNGREFVHRIVVERAPPAGLAPPAAPALGAPAEEIAKTIHGVASAEERNIG